ncbi:hypothetical protein MK079_00800 [Candidatus Gracilibacteria bacterium]|nr:hypothetical protein [Candidatus Gracilibacteria bacterium]
MHFFDYCIRSFSHITQSYFVPEKGPVSELEEKQKPQFDVTDTSSYYTETQLKELQELTEQLDIIKDSETIVGIHSETLRKALLEKGDPQDKEYQELAQKVKRLQQEVSLFSIKEDELSQKIDELKKEAQSQIQELKGETPEFLEQQANEYISERAEELGVEAEVLITLLQGKNYEDAEPKDRIIMIDELLKDSRVIEGLEKYKSETDDIKKAQALVSLTTLLHPSNGGEVLKNLEKNEKIPFIAKIIIKFIEAISGKSFLQEDFYQSRDLRERYVELNSTELGSLSKKHESGDKGSDAINFDDNGASSFGSYQLRSDALQKFAKQNGIEGFESGILTSDHEFTKNWKAKIDELGAKKFHALEHAFIKKTHYDIQMNSIQQAGVQASKFSKTLKNVIWSTAVQHGPNTSIITDVLKDFGPLEPGNPQSEKKLVEAIYAARLEKNPKGENRYNSEKLIVAHQLQVYGENGKGFTSFHAERSRNGTTLCSRTARLNLQEKLGIQDAAHGSSAKESFGAIKGKENFSENLQDLFSRTDINVIDLYCDASPKNREYGHRAVAVREGGNWKIYDPYYKVANGINGVDAQEYITHMQQQKGRTFWGGVGYNSNKVT